MKNYIRIFFTLLLMFGVMNAQNPGQNNYITSYQYWLDNPIPTNAVTVNSPTYPADSVLATFGTQSVDVSSLPAGLHLLYVRLKDVKGKWGSPSLTSFMVGSFTKKIITKVRYWFDNQTSANYIEASSSPIYNSDSTIVFWQNLSVDVSSLSSGAHRLYASVKDAAGQWGSPIVTAFNVGTVNKNFIVKGQYWFNNATPTNPVELAASDIIYNADSSKASAKLSSVAIPTGLTNGKYTVHIRFQDNKGKWGQAQAIQFVQDASLAAPTISAMEYFFGNTDPGVGTALNPRTGTLTGTGGRNAAFQDSFSISQLGLPLGLNKFSVRFKSNKNEWGPTIAGTFSILTRPTLVSSVTDSLRFGTIISGRDSVTKSFVIRNSGDAALKVKVGTKPSTQWQVNFDGTKDSVSLSANSFATESTIVYVKFKPVKSGTISSVIQFATNDSVKPTYNLPVAVKADTAIGKIFTSVDTLNFGNVTINTSIEKRFVISNIGIDSIKVQINSPSQYYPANLLYSPTSGVTRTLGYQKSTDTVQVWFKFTPTSQIAYNTSFTITVNNSKGQFLAQKTIYLRGSGIFIQVPTIKPSATSFNFGAISSRTQDAKDTTLNLTIQNIGQGSLRLKILSATNADTNIYKVTSSLKLPDSLIANGSMTFNVKFKPTLNIYKTYVDTLTILNNSYDGNTALKIAMTGDATQGPPLGVFALSDSSLDYGSVTINFNTVRTISISNKGGNRQLNVTTMNFSNNDFSTTQTVPFQVGPDSTKSFVVKFAPSSLGTILSALTIQTDANARNTRTVDLRGIGVSTPQPIIEPSLSSIAFGATKIQTPNSVYLKIKNAGNDTLKADSIYLAKQTASVFAINKNKLVLAPTKSDSLLVTFTPLAVSTYSDSIIFISNYNPARFGILVSGNGATLAINLDTTITPPNPSVGSGQPQQIGVQLTASLGPNTVAYLYYKLAGKSKFDSLPMISSDLIRFQGQVPASSILSRGAMYYIKITNGIETVTIPPINPTTNPMFVSVAFSTVVGLQPDNPQPVVIATEKSKQKYYRMISVPMDGINGSADTVIGEFGAYNKDSWRLFRYQSGIYVEHTNPNFEKFAPGKGYWFITTKNGKLRSGSGKSVSASGSYAVALQGEWNQIGNPFNFPVRWSDVSKTNNIGQIYSFNGSDYDIASSLIPWEGYFVKNSSANPITVGIPPKDTSVTAIALPKLGKDGTPVLSEKEWMLQLKSTDGDIADNYNFIGVKENASDEYDEFDVEESPKQPSEFLKLKFNHTNWDIRPDYYGYDFREISLDGKYWDFEIQTNTLNENVKISIDRFTSVPEKFDIVLIDKDSKSAQDLRKYNSFFIPSNKKEITRNFRIVVGTKDFIEKNNFGVLTIPLHYGLNQNYPNPFNPTTTIKFALPVTSNISITIFDILGKEIKTILNDVQNEGYYLTSWNATNNRNEKVASGVYFCRISASSIDGAQRFNQTIKLILMR